jgi:hypothetical protein
MITRTLSYTPLHRKFNLTMPTSRPRELLFTSNSIQPLTPEAALPRVAGPAEYAKEAYAILECAPTSWWPSQLLDVMSMCSHELVANLKVKPNEKSCHQHRQYGKVTSCSFCPLKFDYPIALIIPGKCDALANTMPYPNEVNDPYKGNPVPKCEMPNRVRSNKRFRYGESNSVTFEYENAENSLPDRRPCPSNQKDLAYACNTYGDPLIDKHHR